MTLHSSLDTGPGAPRVLAAILPETLATTLATTPGSATPGAAQPFALLLATGQAEGSAATGPLNAPALPAATADTATPEGQTTTLPGILAQLLNPATDTMTPAPDAPTDLPAMPDLILPPGTQAPDLPDGEGATLAPSDATVAEVEPGALAIAPVILPMATPMPAPQPADAKRDPAKTADPMPRSVDAPHSVKTEAAQAQAQAGIEPVRQLNQPTQPEGKPVAAPEAAPPIAEPVPTGAEPPRPVAVSVTQAPGSLPAPAAPALPVLQMTRADWPLDLAERLLESASLRSLVSGGLMEIRLDPDTLGPVTLRLEVTDGTANIAIVTQTPEAARLFTDNQHRLADALARAGLDLGQHSAGTDARGGQPGRDRHEGTGPGAGLADTAKPDAPQHPAPRERRIDLIA